MDKLAKNIEYKDTVMVIIKNNSNENIKLGSESGPAGYIQLNDGGTEKVKLSGGSNSYINGGNLGIGTTTPSEKLEVNGKIEAEDGVIIDDASARGVDISSSADDGVYVYTAGTTSNHYTSSEKNGFEVAGAEGYGLYVGRAEEDGIYIKSASNDGLRIEDAYHYGINITSASQYGLVIFHLS